MRVRRGKGTGMNKLLLGLVAVIAVGCGPESVAVVDDGAPTIGPDSEETLSSEQALATSSFFPLKNGNTWGYSNGATGTHQIKVTQSSGTVHLVEGLGANGAVWLSFSGSRLYVWNTETNRWNTFINFSGNQSGTFSFGGACDRFTSRLVADKIAITTPAGSFNNARRYELTQTPPPHVRCAAPFLGSITLASGAGIVEIRTTRQETFSLATAKIGTTTLPVPSVTGTLTTDRAEYTLANGTTTVRATLTVKNPTNKVQTLNFTSSQQIEFQVLNAAGQTVYTWSADKIFLTALSNVTWQPNQTRTFTQTFDVQAPAGSYTVRGFLPTSAGQRAIASRQIRFVSPTLGACFVGGCSSQLCSDREGMVSTCEWREEYACYQTATCERQASGQCGWTQTAALTQCLGGAGPTPAPCHVGGCSGQVCSDREDVITTCEWRPQYACYRSATCARQTNGQCGWTQTTALTQCLASGGGTP